MRKSLLLWVLIFSLLSTFVIGCGGDDDDDDDDSTGPVLSGLADFADTWYAVAEKSSATPIWGYPEVDYRTLDIILDTATNTYIYTSEAPSSIDAGVATWETRSNVDYLILTSSYDNSVTQIIVNDFDENYAELEYVGSTTGTERMFVRTPGIYGVVDYAATSQPATNVTVSLAFQGTEIATATTNAWGVYGFTTGLTDGNTYYATVNVENYTEASIGVEFDDTMPAYGHLSLTQQGGNTGTITGDITDAVSNSAINGVNVTLDGTTSITGAGFYNFSNVAYGTHTITATADGYQDYSANVNLTGALLTHNIVMTPDSGPSYTLEKISMAWAASSSADFDLHVLTPEINGTTYDIYYNSRGSQTTIPYAEHQGDRTSGSTSPEEVIFSQVYSGTYTVFAERYGSNNDFQSDGLYATFADTDDNFVESVNANYVTGSGNWWIIATITNGVVTEVNELSDTDPAGGGSGDLPDITSLNLSWSGDYDLDLYVLTPSILGTEYEIYYNNQGSLLSAPYIYHSGDDQGNASGGIESVSVNMLFTGSYTVYARRISASDFDVAHPVFEIEKDGASTQYIYSSSASGASTWQYWHICDIDGSTNAITTVNAFELITPTTEKGFQGALEVSSK